MNRIGIILAAVALGGVACTIPDDLDNPCELQTPLPDGGTAPIPAGSDDGSSEGVSPSFDFISTGNSDCEDLICVRLANPVAGFYDDSNGHVHGRCSNNCIVDQANNHSSDCGAQSKGLICTQLSFSQSFINSFCSSDPNDCATIFGTDDSATFCIDPTAQASPSGS